MEEKYLICEDSIEGVFTGIYEAYALKEGHEHIHIQLGEEENLRLFAAYLHIRPDSAKTVKVAETIQKRLGEKAYHDICSALAADDLSKGQAVYRTIVNGITEGSGKGVMGNLANPYVEETFRLARRTERETHRTMGFVRFKEIRGGILFSRIGPICSVVPFIMPHFADRLPLENFIIHDERRGIYGVHPAGKEWYLVSDWEDAVEGMEEISDAETGYKELFDAFCSTIAIRGRTNLKLQQQLMPLRCRKYM